MLLSSIFILLISLSITQSIPCPRECICKPTDMNDADFTRMSYDITCPNAFQNKDKLIYDAEDWSINVDNMRDNNDDDDITNDYVISLDLSNSLSLKKFTNQTVQLTGFSFIMQYLSLANQGKKFSLTSNSFYSAVFEKLKVLNLSSCCSQIPKDCQEIFRPLVNLQLLDLSGSDMYKTCLNTPDTISSTLRDLILRNNTYNSNTFSHSSRLFDGVRTISGKLDLQNSRFQMGSQLQGNCLFDLFQQITILDLSAVQFESTSDNIEIHLAHLLKCKTENGKQLLDLYLRQLKLQRLPEWFANNSFPLLRRLDLSTNNFYSVDINTFSNLLHISLAYNPIRLKEMKWRADKIYESINLRSTVRNRTFGLGHILKNLLKLTRDIDYSDNEGNMYPNITNIPLEKDISTSQFSLNISRTNLHAFQIDFDDIRRLDVSWNWLTELNLDEQVKLNNLDCSNQYLQKLTLNQDILELNELKCSNNSLRTIENFNLINKDRLKVIDLSNNSIDTLTDLFGNLTSPYLRTINLQSNLIRIVRSYVFHEKLISLFEINLSWNKIYKIEKLAFQSPNLQVLNLRGNPLKNIEPKAILTASLRYFFVFNNSEELTNRCSQSKAYDHLLFIYVSWFDQNGTFMRENPIKFSKCLTRYRSQKTIDLIVKKGKHVFGYYALYMAIGASLVAIIFGGIHCYRRNKLTLLAPFQRYRQVDKQGLVENAEEMSQYQQDADETIMNVKELPFTKFTHAPTDV